MKKTYILKINCKGKRAVGKENKGINVEKITIGLKNFLREKKNKENSTDVHKPNVAAEVYNSNKKCDWGEKKAQKLNWIS